MDAVIGVMHAHKTPAIKDMDFLVKAIDELINCGQTCTACADACLAETDNLARLAKCIRLDIDCADVCDTTARLLSRQTHAPFVLERQQVSACLTACELCGGECDMHAEWHEHCRICGEMCRSCAMTCKELLDKLPQ